MVPRLDARRTPGCAGATCTRRPSSRTSGCVAENRARGKLDPEFELVDTGIFDDGRYWEITADYAKAAPDDLLHPHHASATPARSRRRSTCCRRSGSATPGRGASTTPTPSIAARRAARSSPSTTTLGARVPRRRAARPRPLFCDNETNARAALSASPSATPYPKDGINDHVVARRGDGQPGADRDQGRVPLPPRGRRRRDGDDRAAARRDRDGGLGDDFDADHARAAKREADEFYAELTPAGASRGRGARRCARRSPGCSGRSSSTTTTSRAGSTATRPARRRRPSGSAGRNARLEAPRQHATSSRCPTRGSTPGTRPGTSPSTASRSPTSTRSSPRQQLLLLVPRVVHAPERPAARLRVGVRRRQPAGARVGRAARVRDRRPTATTTSSSASSTSCC